jgi:hypothetical protein
VTQAIRLLNQYRTPNGTPLACDLLDKAVRRCCRAEPHADPEPPEHRSPRSAMGWLLHIMIDVPTQLHYSVTRFLGPVSEYRFDGIAW